MYYMAAGIRSEHRYGSTDIVTLEVLGDQASDLSVKQHEDIGGSNGMHPRAGLRKIPFDNVDTGIQGTEDPQVVR